MGTVPPAVEDWLTSNRHIAFLGTSVNDRPHVAPIWYIYEDDTFRFSTSGKRKIENARTNPRVSIALQDDEAGYPEWLAVFLGTAAVDTEVERVKRVTRTIFSKYMGDDVGEWPEFYQTQVTDPPPDRAIIDVEVSTVFSRDY